MTALRSGSATDVGRVRTSNQDVALEDPDLFAVADGMGGHVGGEVAARVAIDALRASFQRQSSVEGLRSAVAEANRAVWHQSQTETGLRGMGTTLTATALVREADGRQVIALANVGDSRAYVYSKGDVIQVTADHSLAEEKVRQGELTEAEAAVHPHRHILTRALGVSSDVDVDLWELHLQEGDRILLCSDGLTNEVADDLIGDTLANVQDPMEAARVLVKAAIEHGGSDNVTVVVVDVVGDDAHPPKGPTGGSSAAGAGAVADQAVPEQAAGDQAAGDGHGGSGAQHDGDGDGSGTAAGLVAGAGPAEGATATGEALDASASSRAAQQAGVLVADDARPEGPAGAMALDGRALAAPSQPPPGQPTVGGAATPTRGQRTAPARHRPTRRERRRQRRMAGIPRLVTVRVVLFFALLAGVVYAGYYLVRWYAMNDWYVTVDHQHLVIYQGRPGGFLWFKPHLIDETSVTTADILPVNLPTVQRPRQEPSAAAARRYIRNLHQEFLAVQQLGSGGTPNTAAPTTSAPNSPSSSTSTTGAAIAVRGAAPAAA